MYLSKYYAKLNRLRSSYIRIQSFFPRWQTAYVQFKIPDDTNSHRGITWFSCASFSHQFMLCHVIRCAHDMRAHILHNLLYSETYSTDLDYWFISHCLIRAYWISNVQKLSAVATIWQSSVDTMTVVLCYVFTFYFIFCMLNTTKSHSMLIHWWSIVILVTLLSQNNIFRIVNLKIEYLFGGRFFFDFTAHVKLFTTLKCCKAIRQDAKLL